MSDYKDIQKQSDAELVTLVKDEREALRAARFKAAGSGKGDIKTIRAAKKRIAQSLTELAVRAKAAAKKTE